MSDLPTIVLVHGALTDASVWNGVSSRLQDRGYPVIAPAIPLRGVAFDAAALASVLDTIDRPLVIVGHSYGGSIISHPAIARSSVRALVFVAAFMPDIGEAAGELNGRWPGSKLGEATTLLRSHPGGQDLYLKPEHFREVYATDVPSATVALMAAAQRPLDTAALGETFDGAPTWRGVPSWAVVSTRDHSLPPQAQRFMAERAGATVVEVEASHASPISQPDAVTEAIVTAARSAV